MTTATAPAASIEAVPAPSLARLARVELRKMVDTRAGFWLLVTVAALTVALTAAIAAFGNEADRTFASLLEVAIAPSSFLLPVVAILLVTTEFTHRTALVTFALVPRRAPVLAAKAVAALALTVVAFAVALAVAAVAALVAGSDAAAGRAMTAGLLGQDALSLVIVMAMGLAFGLAARTSAPAIVAYFVIPTVWTLLGAIPALEDAALWLDPSRWLTELPREHLSALEWARTATSTALFLVVPLAIGLSRLRREELQ